MIYCIKCNEEMMHQSTTETDEEVLEVFYCNKCKNEVLINMKNDNNRL